MFIREGGGLLNTVINKLPFELHIPGGYQYCGPGTKLKKRLARNDPGINPLDQACKSHDIAYSNNTDLNARHEADKQLEYKAWERVKAKDSTFGEKAAALLVTNAMKAKRKLGMGIKKRRYPKKSKKRSSKKSVAFKSGIVSKIFKTPPVSTNMMDIAKDALHSARIAVKNAGGRKKVVIPRVIPLPKTGGILPLLPAIFAGLSALGGLAGGAAGVYRAVKGSHEAKEKLKEAERHNKTMEAVAIKGTGLYLKKYKTGFGLYLNNNKKNF